jgi:hypothetical protein
MIFGQFCKIDFGKKSACSWNVLWGQVGSVLSFVKENWFPRFKFLKDGWMEYDKGQDSFSTFVQGNVQIPEGAEYTDQWERVICPIIQAKYATIRCNLNN